jgi:DNA-directed RNA polymerase specialized sigma24 family protein
MSIRKSAITADELLRHSAWIRALARHLVDEAAAADDVVQETWMSLLRARPDMTRPLRPWLHSVLRNAARMRWREATRRIERERQAPGLMGPLPTPEKLSGARKFNVRSLRRSFAWRSL